MNSSVAEENKLYQELEQLLKQFLEGCLASHVDSLVAKEKGLYQELEQFLEDCLAFESSDARTYQLLTELAASENVSIGEIQSRVSILYDKLIKIEELARYCGSVESVSSYLSIRNKRKLKKRMKKKLEVITQCNELIAEIVDIFWNYLSVDFRKSLEAVYSSILDIDTDKYTWQAEAKLSHFGKLPDITKRILRFYRSISHLRNSLLAKSVTQQERDDEWYEPNMMKLFLDFLVDEALSNRSKLVPYTEEMSARAKDLIAGVHINDD